MPNRSVVVSRNAPFGQEIAVGRVGEGSELCFVTTTPWGVAEIKISGRRALYAAKVQFVVVRKPTVVGGATDGSSAPEPGSPTPLSSPVTTSVASPRRGVSCLALAFRVLPDVPDEGVSSSSAGGAGVGSRLLTGQ